MWLTNLHFSGHGQLGLSQLVWIGLVAAKQGLKYCLTNSLFKSSYFLSCALCFDSWFQTLRLMFVFGFVWIGSDYTPQVPTFSNVFDLLWLFLHHCFCFVWMGFNLFLAPKELYTWYCPMTIRSAAQHPLFEHTPVLNNNFEYWCRDDFGDCDFYED